MKIEELRIGNIISYECTAHIVSALQEGRIESYWLKDVDRSDLYWDRPENHEGFPLTEEWLIKAGFEKYLNGDYYRLKEEMCIGAWSDKFSIYLPYYHLDTYTGRISIKYVHQLQNLYWCLTGEELELKH